MALIGSLVASALCLRSERSWALAAKFSVACSPACGPQLTRAVAMQLVQACQRPVAQLYETFKYLLEAILESSFFVTSIRFTLIDFFLFRVAFEIDGPQRCPWLWTSS